ncbi:MAG: hypothetical protein U9N81_05470 [Bacillota bacterium]|nr:hypothetical protein [Bacillota bacterium]
MLHYIKHECADTREWLIILHGMSGDLEQNKFQINFFKEWFNLLLIDLPGHGSSDLQEEYTCKNIADAIDRIMVRESIQ